MDILVADDEPVTRTLVRRVLENGGYRVQTAGTGTEAARIWVETRPQIVVTDWMMPEMDGDELCRLIRATEGPRYTYIILVTARDSVSEIIEGLSSGADDYVTKPFDGRELLMRVGVGRRIANLEASLARQIAELQEAHDRVTTLESFLPICAYCRQVRDDEGFWGAIEEYVEKNTGASFTHGICPTCARERVMPQIEELRSATQAHNAPDATT